MNKQHQSPEFTVIKQNQANAKFFVASGDGSFQGNPPSTTVQNSASQYDAGDDISM